MRDLSSVDDLASWTAFQMERWSVMRWADSMANLWDERSEIEKVEMLVLFLVVEKG